jgi:hypothetical protein
MVDFDAAVAAAKTARKDSLAHCWFRRIDRPYRVRPDRRGRCRSTRAVCLPIRAAPELCALFRPRRPEAAAVWHRPRMNHPVKGWSTVITVRPICLARAGRTCHRSSRVRPENPEDAMTTALLPPTPPVPPTAPAGPDGAATVSPAASPVASHAPSPAATSLRLAVVADKIPVSPVPAGCNSSSPSTDAPGEAFRARKAAAKAGADVRARSCSPSPGCVWPRPASSRHCCCRTSHHRGDHDAGAVDPARPR